MPPYGLPTYGINTPHSFFNRQISSYFGEKIPIEPDMDARWIGMNGKALPDPPVTSRQRFCRRWRLGALVAVLLGVAGFVLGLLVVIAGRERGEWADEWMVKLNTSRVGQDVIRFERASSTSAASATQASPTATSSQAASSPLDSLNPFSTASPLNPQNPSNPFNGLMPSLEPVLGNLTDSVNDGLGDAINQVTEGLAAQIGIKDFYYLYLSGICEGNFSNGTRANGDGVVVEKCMSWGDASSDFSSKLPNLQSSIVIGMTNISVPLLADLTHGVGGLSTTLSALHTALFAFLVSTLITTLLSALVALPSIFFPSSRLLIYTNLFVSTLSSLTSFISAVLVTVLVVGVPWAIGSLAESIGVSIVRGVTVLVFLWVVWGCCAGGSAYWFAVWFVEARKTGFARRERGRREVGNWRGIGGEIGRDWKGYRDL